MELMVLVVADCPHAEPARMLLEQAARDVGIGDATVRTRVVADEGEAVELGFAGSPTFLIDGADPFAADQVRPGLSCRIYRTGQGVVAGLPDPADVREALRRAMGRPD